jgi:glutaconate CoA-transferase, subunit A
VFIQYKAGKRPLEDQVVSTGDIHRYAMLFSLDRFGPGGCQDRIAHFYRFQESGFGPAEHNVGIIHRDHGRVVCQAENKSAVHQSRAVDRHIGTGFHFNAAAAIRGMDRLAAQPPIDLFVGPDVHFILPMRIEAVSKLVINRLFDGYQIKLDKQPGSLKFLLLMKQNRSKHMELKAAVAAYVPDGAHISIGGFTVNRNPMAAVYEIIRQRKKKLHLYAHSNGHGVDELIGGGCVDLLEIAYGGSGRFAPTCIRFRKAVENSRLQVEDYSNYQMTLRFMAGAMGVPFLPTRSGLGSDIVNRWGFSPEQRQADTRLPDEKLIVMDNPFGDWGAAHKLVLVPAINPDVTIIHVQKADATGLARIEGLPFADVEQAKAARHLIITCEELLEPGLLKEHPDSNQIPPFCVDAVVQVSHGAYPTACYGHYDYDPVYLNRYKECAPDDERHQAYLEEFVFGTGTHAELMEKISPEQLKAIQADRRTGYAVGLDRK